MSIPQDSPWRGCAAKFPQPVDEEAMAAARDLFETIYNYNCRFPTKNAPPLEGIVYRSSNGEEDTVRRVFRWDVTPYEKIFQNGFQARRQQETPDDVYFSLDNYVHQRPLDSTRPATHPFISTTINSSWHPSLKYRDDDFLSSTETDDHQVFDIYRYEIYAPGGIWVAQTLAGGDHRCQYPHAQHEVCFVSGIAPQYIRSAQLFRLISDAEGYTRREKVDHIIRVNGNFNPQSDPPRLLRLRRPVFDYMAEDGRRLPLTICIWGNNAGGPQGPQACTDDSAINWYAGEVANSESYIDSAFRSCMTNEAHLFMGNEYVLLNYAPGTTGDTVLDGPLLICDKFPSLKGTAFAEHGIDCAFRSTSEEELAFIFSGNLCAVINYAPGTGSNDRIVKGPMTIVAMFPFLKGTVFESGIDSAFESTEYLEAYLFKGKDNALINYGPDCHLIVHRLINEGFTSLRSTIFMSGIDAAFASHRHNESYIFKGDSYALFDFGPVSKADYVMGGVKKIRPNWPSLRAILPRKNRGLDLDVYVHCTKEKLLSPQVQNSPQQKKILCINCFFSVKSPPPVKP